EVPKLLPFFGENELDELDCKRPMRRAAQKADRIGVESGAERRHCKSEASPSVRSARGLGLKSAVKVDAHPCRGIAGRYIERHFGSCIGKVSSVCRDTPDETHRPLPPLVPR